jgi:hypothetical protein
MTMLSITENNKQTQVGITTDQQISRNNETDSWKSIYEIQY